MSVHIHSSAVLNAASQKLLAPHVPDLLRMTAFLRLSCSAMDTPGYYSQLLKALSEVDSEWWTSCEVTAEGLLQSSNPFVQALLLPILSLYAKPETVTQFRDISKAA